jgi:hypothetical protein
MEITVKIAAAPAPITVATPSATPAQTFAITKTHAAASGTMVRHRISLLERGIVHVYH